MCAASLACALLVGGPRAARGQGNVLAQQYRSASPPDFAAPVVSGRQGLPGQVLPGQGVIREASTFYQLPPVIAVQGAGRPETPLGRFTLTGAGRLPEVVRAYPSHITITDGRVVTADQGHWGGVWPAQAITAPPAAETSAEPGTGSLSGLAAAPTQTFDPGYIGGLASRPRLPGGSLDDLVNETRNVASSAGSAPSGPAAAPSVTSAAAGTRQAAAVATQRATSPALISTPSVDVVTTGEIQMFGASETSEVLQASASVRNVDVQRRSPIDFDPHVRGYHIGQVYTQADGAFWHPARQDLDSMLSKLDPALIQDVIVVPGPYGLRYGPGFSFIDIVTSPTPRYDDHPQIHMRTGVTYRDNGAQLYGRETFFGGGEDWGFILNYGNRTGSDYKSGDGTPIPSSYQAQNFLGQLGFDHEDHQWEFRAQHLDQTDTEYAGQFFDLDDLVTDGYSLNYAHDPQCGPWDLLEVHSWYNRTWFAGDTRNSGKRSFNVINRVEAALGNSIEGETDGSFVSSGARGQVTYGADDAAQLRVGSDFRYQDHGLEEQFTIFDGPNPTVINTNLPSSRLFDPGVFAEWTLPWHRYWTTSIGGRADWVHTSTSLNDIRPDTSLTDITDARAANDVLYAFYVTNELQLTSNWKSRFGVGHAQRAPTLVERYADGVFLGIIQSGFSRVIGNPTLAKERAWQVDGSLEGEVGDWEIRLSGFHSWVLDYVTYSGNVITDPSGARLLRTLNTDLATLVGAEGYLEKQLSHQLSAFGAVQFLEGRDREINRPLAGIAPLEGRTGLRMVDSEGGQRWGLEAYARIVDDQDRLGALRIGTTTVVDVIALETPTPGFTTFHVRGYWNVSSRLHLVAGIDNVFDRNYLDHLNLRIPDQGPFTGTRVLEPGFAPYVTAEWTY